MKYTREFLKPIVLSSLSIADVMRKLGYKTLNGGSHCHVTAVIKSMNLDTSHFLGQGRNSGEAHLGGSDKVAFDKILVYNRRNGLKELTSRLRRAMIESGIPFVCGTCFIGPVWKSRSLVLQISHKDGDSLNNRKENLHFECPNCHSQTDDYGGKGRGKNFRPIGGTADVLVSRASALTA